MPYRLTINGVQIECDTTEELATALALGGAKVLDSSSRSRKKGHETPIAPEAATRGRAPLAAAPNMTNAQAWAPPDGVKPLLSALPKNERLALGFLATSDGEITLEQLSRAAGLHDKRRGTLMIARWKRLVERFEMAWPHFLSFRIVGTRKNRMSLYKAERTLKG